MDSWTRLESYGEELVSAINTLRHHSPGPDVQRSLLDLNAEGELRRARGQILSSIANIRTLMFEPTDFLEHVAIQCELLACLRWLGRFQILACIPLVGSVPIQDVADLSTVPEKCLSRIIRLTATAGFLHEPKPGHVAHTSSSASFVANPSFLDAAMFLAESAIPAALQMAPATQQWGDSHQPGESAFNIALNIPTPFHVLRKQNSKLGRQWFAYLHHAGGFFADDDTVDILAQLNWSNVSDIGAHIVEVGALSTHTAQRLCDQFPALHFLVQISEPYGQSHSSIEPKRYTSRGPELSTRITVTNRAVGARQTATGSAVYILHLPSPSPNEILAELQAHLTALRTSNGIMLILTARLLPEPGSNPDAASEALTRSRDLILHQLSNESEIEMSALLGLIDTVADTSGKLAVVNKLYSRRRFVAALVVKYQVFADP